MKYVNTQTDMPPLARPLGEEQGAVSGVSGAPSPEALRELEFAQIRSKKIRKAVSVALFNGWTTGFFGATSLLFGLFDFTTFILGVALAVVAYNEFVGAKGLKQFEEKAARRLGYNQLGFCVTLIIYAVWSIYVALTTPNEIQAALEQAGSAANMLGSIDTLYRNITLATYGGLIVGSLIFQGGTAWYYFSRIPYIRAYVRETPEWVMAYQRVL